jgi:hypothetical protein
MPRILNLRFQITDQDFQNLGVINRNFPVGSLPPGLSQHLSYVRVGDERGIPLVYSRDKWLIDGFDLLNQRFNPFFMMITLAFGKLIKERERGASIEVLIFGVKQP